MPAPTKLCPFLSAGILETPKLVNPVAGDQSAGPLMPCLGRQCALFVLTDTKGSGECSLALAPSGMLQIANALIRLNETISGSKRPLA